ncbi:glycoside hydrolase domain-containing protein [Actinoallomurus sp. CA-142502]|uniref:glycoside hydrolase domain-containing protein n=1 Tax=Actinoallomurus sp. CA-142502 TaxID=3239885 RepID=UPI003D922AF3
MTTDTGIRSHGQGREPGRGGQGHRLQRTARQRRLPQARLRAGRPATTLEYGLANFGIAQLAQRLGDNGTSQAFMKRSHAWKTIYNPVNDWIQPRFGSNGAE